MLARKPGPWLGFIRLKNLPLVCLALLVAALSIHTVANPDLWYHLTLGQKILTSGRFQPHESLIMVPPNFVNFYWLFQIICTLVMKSFGLGGIAVLFGALWLAIFFVSAKIIGLAAKPALFVFALTAIIICQIRFQERPEVFSYLFLTLDLYILSQWQKPYSLKQILKFMIPVQILWCNIHGYFILGPLLLAVRIFGLSIQPKSNKWASLYWGPAALLIASLVSPFGWKNLFSVFDQWTYTPLGAPWLTELQSTASFGLTQWAFGVFWLFWIATAAATLIRFTKIRDSFFEVAVSAAGLYLSAAAARYVPLLVFSSLPLWATFQFQASNFRILKPLAAATSLFLVFCTIRGGYFKSLYQPFKFGIGVSVALFPEKFTMALDKMKLIPGTRWFCDGTTGSFLEYHYPTVHFYGDSRYMSRDSLDFFEATQNPAAFNKLDQQKNFDFVVLDVTRSESLLTALMSNADWQLTYSDLTTAFFERSLSKHKLFASEDLHIYQGEDLSDLPLGNAAIQWTLASAQSNSEGSFLGVLGQLEKSSAVPSPVLDIALSYLRMRPNSELLKLIFNLRARMVALSPTALHDVDQKLSDIRSGAFWRDQDP